MGSRRASQQDLVSLGGIDAVAGVLDLDDGRE
jgi:hypothetical protein